MGFTSKEKEKLMKLAEDRVRVIVKVANSLGQSFDIDGFIFAQQNQQGEVLPMVGDNEFGVFVGQMDKGADGQDFPLYVSVRTDGMNALNENGERVVDDLVRVFVDTVFEKQSGKMVYKNKSFEKVVDVAMAEKTRQTRYSGHFNKEMSEFDKTFIHSILGKPLSRVFMTESKCVPIAATTWDAGFFSVDITSGDVYGISPSRPKDVVFDVSAKDNLAVYEQGEGQLASE